MARKLFQKSRRLGFTLVELLIVVAIIGVLSTIGVPTFKRMVQKSKKSEAKVALGGIYTSEIAFFSEYGGYGNYLKGVGFEFEGSTAIYTNGFPTNACAASGTVYPALNGTVGGQINSTYSAYYTGYSTYGNIAGGEWAGRSASGTCLAGSVETNGGYFIATATGCLASGCTASGNAGSVSVDTTAGNTTYGTVLSVSGVANASASNQDSWVIDKQRHLQNVNDGVF
jgi:type IV pilus assembly protein PilA